MKEKKYQKCWIKVWKTIILYQKPFTGNFHRVRTYLLEMALWGMIFLTFIYLFVKLVSLYLKLHTGVSLWIKITKNWLSVSSGWYKDTNNMTLPKGLVCSFFSLFVWCVCVTVWCVSSSVNVLSPSDSSTQKKTQLSDWVGCGQSEHRPLLSGRGMQQNRDKV